MFIFETLSFYYVVDPSATSQAIEKGCVTQQQALANAAGNEENCKPGKIDGTGNCYLYCATTLCNSNALAERSFECPLTTTDTFPCTPPGVVVNQETCENNGCCWLTSAGQGMCFAKRYRSV